MESNPLKKAKHLDPDGIKLILIAAAEAKAKTILPFKRHKGMTDSLPSASSAAGAKRFKETSV